MQDKFNKIGGNLFINGRYKIKAQHDLSCFTWYEYLWKQQGLYSVALNPLSEYEYSFTDFRICNFFRPWRPYLYSNQFYSNVIKKSIKITTKWAKTHLSTSSHFRDIEFQKERKKHGTLFTTNINFNFWYFETHKDRVKFLIEFTTNSLPYLPSNFPWLMKLQSREKKNFGANFSNYTKKNLD